MLRAAGFRLDIIYPADDPQAALLSLGEQQVRLAAPKAPPLPRGLPELQPGFVLTKASGDAGKGSSGLGRARMGYRDLIPGRLGGRYIASHISVAGGPVDDWVHYHRIALQLIVVRRGWVRVVYQDQGVPFVMNPGDLVLQPPGLRHRVLESSAGLEVIEISAPAIHETFADHEFALPNGERPGRVYGGQRFLHHVAASAAWSPVPGGGEAQETGLCAATDGFAEARTIRPAGAGAIDFPAHDGELVFSFVLDGYARLDLSAALDRSGASLGPADAFVIPPGERWSLRAMSGEFRLLHVSTTRLDGARLNAALLDATA